MPAAAQAPHAFVIPPDHPCLPGHFPGAPVVPGVVILDEVLALLPTPAGHARQLGWVKFVQPLLPGEVATITLATDGARHKFSVARGEVVLASGIVSFVPLAAG